MLYNINVSKLNELVMFDTDKLPESSIQYVMRYGFNKSINDAHAAVKRDAFPVGDEGTTKWLAEVRKVAMARVDQILTGTCPSTGGTVISPVLVAAAKAGLTEAQMLALIEAAANPPAQVEAPAPVEAPVVEVPAPTGKKGAKAA